MNLNRLLFLCIIPSLKKDLPYRSGNFSKERLNRDKKVVAAASREMQMLEFVAFFVYR